MNRVVSGHHGICPHSSNRIFGSRAAKLFGSTLPYLPYKCTARTEFELLRSSCETRADMVVFITLARPQTITFLQDAHGLRVRVQTFGAEWQSKYRREILFFDLNDFPQIALIAAAHSKPKRPGMFELFGVAGDPLDLASGECPTG